MNELYIDNDTAEIYHIQQTGLIVEDGAASKPFI